MLENIANNDHFLWLRCNLHQTVIQIQENIIECRWACAIGDQQTCLSNDLIYIILNNGVCIDAVCRVIINRRERQTGCNCFGAKLDFCHIFDEYELLRRARGIRKYFRSSAWYVTKAARVVISD